MIQICTDLNIELTSRSNSVDATIPGGAVSGAATYGLVRETLSKWPVVRWRWVGGVGLRVVEGGTIGNRGEVYRVKSQSPNLAWFVLETWWFSETTRICIFIF